MKKERIIFFKNKKWIFKKKFSFQLSSSLLAFNFIKETALISSAFPLNFTVKKVLFSGLMRVINVGSTNLKKRFFKRFVLFLSPNWKVIKPALSFNTLVKACNRISSIFSSFTANNRVAILGCKDRLRVTGYARKAWLSRGKGLIFFKVGQSFVNSISIPTTVSLKLFKKRIISLFSSSLRCLTIFSQKMFFLRPADDYKGEGIQLVSKKMLMKAKFKKRK